MATPLRGTLDVSQGMTIWLCLFWSGGGGQFVFLRLLSPSKYHYRHPMIGSDKQKQPHLKTATLN